MITCNVKKNFAATVSCQGEIAADYGDHGQGLERVKPIQNPDAESQARKAVEGRLLDVTIQASTCPSNNKSESATPGRNVHSVLELRASALTSSNISLF